MNEISLPYHLIIPLIISILILGTIFIKRNRLFTWRKRKWFWISLTVCFALYFLILSATIYTDISCQLDLRSFDLNGDGTFSANEITPEQEAAMGRVIADVGRNFAFITGLIFSVLLSIPVFITGIIYDYIKRIRTSL